MARILNSFGNRKPKERHFGFLASTIFFGLGCYCFFNRLVFLGAGLLLIGGVILSITLIKPNILKTSLVTWLRIGHAIGTVVTPIILSLIYWLLITPVAIFFVIIRRDELRLRYSTTKSYWIDVQPPERDTDRFKDQF